MPCSTSDYFPTVLGALGFPMKGQPEPIRQFVTACLDDTDTPFTLDDGRQLTELMEAAYIAHREGRQVELG